MTAPLGSLPDDALAVPATLSAEVMEMLDLLHTVRALSGITLQARLVTDLAVQVRVLRTRRTAPDGKPAEGFAWEATVRDGLLPAQWAGRSSHRTPEAAFEAAIRTVAFEARRRG